MISEVNIHQIFQRIGKSVLNYSILGKGEASIVYKVETDKGIFALKTALYPERKKKVLREAEIRNFFIENGINCIPPPIFSDDSLFPNGAVIYEFVAGSKPDFNDFDLIKQFAQITGKIHQIDYELIDYGFSNIEKLSSFLEQTIKKIITNFPHLMNQSIISAFKIGTEEFKALLPPEKERVMIGINAHLHGDLSDNFIVDSNDKIWLLDWENSEYGDIVDEISWFLSVNDFSLEKRAIFFQEYQLSFPEAKKVNFEDLYSLYAASNTIFNICWGLDQLDMNIKQKLEPERKLRDLAITATEWEQFFSKEASSLMIEGIDLLTKEIG
ncbi:MAG: aminoglycoside phosphotransferase family protein [Candidatus Heimdallarchaeota archaeon]|nr:aminoglycoside phosphotransferase family protein [Candidatus Heimdallarchaeota archaeon]